MALTEQELHIEEKMMAAYDVQSSTVLANQNQYRKTGRRKIGLETEYSLIHSDGSQASEQQRDAIINGHKSWLQPELGAAQLELTTDPEPICDQGITRMIDQLVQRETYIYCAAKSQGLQVLKSGTNPFIQINEIVRSSKPKYQIVPDFYNKERTNDDTIIGRTEKVDVGDLSIIALFNSIQLNLEASSPEDGIDLLNRAIAISPTVVALTGNSRYLSGKDTNISDMRMLAWSKAVDTRTPEQKRNGIEETRAGIPDQYFDSLDHYFRQIKRYPFILDAPEVALAVGIGMYWKDARVKVIGYILVVEPRPIPMQPTIQENIAATLFYLGRLNYSQIEKEALLPMSLVKENKQSAMQDGLYSNLWNMRNGLITKSCAKEIMLEEIQKAEAGLSNLGLNREQLNYLKLLKERINIGTPSDQLARLVQRYQNDGESRNEEISIGLLVLTDS